MIVYGLSCICSVLVMYLGQKTERGQRHPGGIVFFSALPLILTAAFRYDVGRDYLFTYVSYFEALRDHLVPESQRMEILYHSLNQAVIWLGGGYEWVFGVCAVIFYLPVMSQISRDSPNPALSAFLLTGMGYVFVFFNAMRQMTGCALTMYSLRFIQKKRLIPFLVCIALAAGCHTTCIIFAAVYFLGRIKVKPAVAWGATGGVALLNGPLSSLIKSVLAMTHYKVYLASMFDTGKTAWVMLAMNALVLLVFSLLYRDSPQFQLYFNLQVAALWVTMFSGSVVLSLRLLWMFGMPAVISLPIALEGLPREKDRRLMSSTVVLLYTLYAFITVGLQNSNSVMPYQTILSRWI